MGICHENGILDTTFWKVAQKMQIKLKNSMKLTFLQPSVMVAKGKISFTTMSHDCEGYFSFATVPDGCEEAYFMGFSHENGILNTTFGKFSPKMQILLKNSMKLTFLQLSVMVAKGKISFATMTHDCEAVIIDKFWSPLKIRINQ